MERYNEQIKRFIIYVMNHRTKFGGIFFYEKSPQNEV